MVLLLAPGVEDGDARPAAEFQDSVVDVPLEQVVQEDLGCFIQLGKKVEVQFFDPKSLMGKNLL